MNLCFVLDNLLNMAGEEEAAATAAEEGLGKRVFFAHGYDPIAPRSHFVDVPHVRQSFNWDCGLACVLMVLRTLDINRDDDFCDLEELCCTRSIWTVDLAYLLHKFSVKFSFFTVTLGANPDFSAETFYRMIGGYVLEVRLLSCKNLQLKFLALHVVLPEQLHDDLGRVDELFQKALETGINIQCRSISSQEISVLILSGQYIAIALVDKIKLSQSSLEDMVITRCYAESSDYMGHYVVVCGYDADTDEFEIRDPASLRKYERVSLDRFNEARKSYGTDEDILVVSLSDGRDGN